MAEYKDILIQTPLVAAFIVFTLVILTKFLVFIAQQRTDFLNSLDQQRKDYLASASKERENYLETLQNFVDRRPSRATKERQQPTRD